MKNIFIKTLFRKPAQVTLLVLLLILASFVLTMRGVEYLTVTENINKIGGHYRAIGVLSNTIVTDLELLEGANLVAQSTYVGIEDRRRGFVGVLQDMTSSDISAMWCVYNTTEQTEITDVFFYGTLIERNVEEGVWRNNPWDYGVDLIVLTIFVEDVRNGHPEHITSEINSRQIV